VKLPLEVVVTIAVPPVATVLAWCDIVRRRDLSDPLSGWWAVVCAAPLVGPLVYLGIGRGSLW